MVWEALAASADLEKTGVDCEVVDLRTIMPLDQTAILDSVKKTHRVVIVHEAPKIGGVGGEIAGLIAEKSFSDLKAPVMRVGALYTPVPRPPFESIYLPNKDKIIQTVKMII